MPPALIGLVAQRGQTELLERLLKLSKLAEPKPAAKPAICVHLANQGNHLEANGKHSEPMANTLNQWQTL